MTDTPQSLPIEILHYWTNAVLFRGQPGEDLKRTVERAVLVGASLDGASLDGASLDGASLDGASLVGARLDGASLDGASLVGARLVGASLDGASLVGARLDGASLDGASLVGASLVGARLVGASLDGASLDGASLVGARLDGASLDGASLVGFRRDIELVLYENPKEVTALLGALEAGRVDGSCYVGDCCCLVGTIAKARGCDIDSLISGRDSSRPAEQWFMLIKPGDTPDKSTVTKLTVEWVRSWLARQTVESVGP
jgi:hypothetical protein